ncbi:hypothetical protein FPRO04_03837 [Fusarium proliferatum]|nr:hypothetical protein FPRO03_06029 [Fusarium proliferatum]KAG4268748.1 hypothetical protein FPRO04_03837 [Fusarium proliferatum]
MAPQLGSPELYTIAWIAALPIERAAATALLDVDEIHDEPEGFIQHEIDNNSYSWGRIGEHNIVIASLQAGVYGTISAATTASDLICSLPHIRFGLLVGIGGGIAKPDEDQDIRLGDVVVSQPTGTTGGVVQYDFGKAKADGIWEQKGSLSKPPPVLLHALASLQARHEMAPSKIPDLLEIMWSANNRFMTKGKRNYTHPGAANDRLYKSEYSHVGGATCSKCDSAWEVEREERDSTDPEIHYGIIASGDSLIKDAVTRDKLWERQQFLCVEMEAAGLMDKFPCLVIRGICDYADSHKNDRWQRYAAATAAAFAVELLEHVPAKQVHATRKVIEAVKSIEGKIDSLSVSVQNIDSKIVFDRLPDAESARYDSQAEEHNSTCLANTRVALLKELSEWIEDDTSKPILWLNGMAGTGKSTIARTLAKSRAETGDLGASFFFKRGEADRESLAKFVPSIARQLARAVPGYAQIVRKTLDSDPDIVRQAVAKQFSELIEAPLQELAKTPLAFVIDALDECEKEDEIKSLIRILSSATSIRKYLRVLITSRPDLPIRLGFAEANGTYQALVLHDMPVNTIEHDIMTFLVHEFERIRFEFNSAVPIELGLPRDWPGDDLIIKLTEMAVPLFIFAATVCRFVSNRKVGDPSEQLSKYFQLSKNNYGSHLERTYGPVLRSTITGVSEEEGRRIVEQTCHIVGSIVILANPLSIMAMSTLLELPVRVVHSRLNALHSILNIPANLHEPVRLLHVSLRDYLTDNNQNQNLANEFWVDERLVHLGLFKSCLRIMNHSLREDICGLVWPGTQRTEIPSERVASYISDELQYACRHWAYHFQRIETPLLNLDEVLEFLQKHLLHWLEALSLVGRFRESVQVIKILQTVVKEEDNDIMSDEEESGYGISGREEDDDIMSDEENFDTRNQEEGAYTGSDKSAYDASSNSQHYPRLFLKVWHVGTGELMGSLAVKYDRQPFQFSPDSRLLVSISDTSCAIVLALDTAESATENCLAGSEQIIHPALMCNCYNRGFDYNDAFDKYPPHFFMEFSPDSSLLAIMSTCADEYAVWETKTFQCIRCQSMNPFFRTSFELASWYRESVSVALTNNASIMMAGTFPMERDRVLYPRTVFEIRWINSAEVISTLDCQEPIKSTKFSLDQTTLATITESGSIQTWRVETGECLTLFESYQAGVQLFLSPDFTLLASAGLTRTISVWGNGTRATDQSSRKVSDPIMSVVLSLDRTLAASSSYYGVVRVWNMDTYGCIHEFNDGDQMQISDYLSLQLFQFTKDGKYMFMSRVSRKRLPLHQGIYYLNGHFRAWDLTTGECVVSFQTTICTPFALHEGSAVSVSPDEHWIFSVRDRNVALIALDTFSVTRELTFAGPICDVAISPNSRFLFVLYTETPEPEKATHNHQEFLLSKFSIDSGYQLASFKLPITTSGILVVSSDAKFVVLRTVEGALAILTDTGESLYQFELSLSAYNFSLTQNDSTLVMYDSPYLILRDFLTGLLLHRLRIDTSIVPVRFDFDANTKEFHTNLGTLALRRAFKDETPEIRLDKNFTGYGISYDGSWLLWKHHKVFWLWPEMRPRSGYRQRVGYIQVSGSTVIIGTTTGRVLFFKFDIQSLLGMQ